MLRYSLLLISYLLSSLFPLPPFISLPFFFFCFFFFYYSATTHFSILSLHSFFFFFLKERPPPKFSPLPLPAPLPIQKMPLRAGPGKPSARTPPAARACWTVGPFPPPQSDTSRAAPGGPPCPARSSVSLAPATSTR